MNLVWSQLPRRDYLLAARHGSNEVLRMKFESIFCSESEGQPPNGRNDQDERGDFDLEWYESEDFKAWLRLARHREDRDAKKNSYASTAAP